MQYLRQSTSVSVVIGPVWATADGALKADLAYNASGINCDIYKNGTKADITLANSAGDGYFRAASGEALYLLTLSTGHTDTLGRLTITLSATGYYCKPVDYMIVPANVWDSLFGADYLQVDAVQVKGSDATNQIRDAVVDDATRIDASALNTLSGHDPGEAIMGATDLGTGAGLTSLASAANLATVAGYVDTEVAAVLAAVDTEVAAIKAKTDNLPANTSTEIAACKAILDILKIIQANKSIENESGTTVTYRNDADSANAGTQSWTEATKTRGAYTPA